MVISPLGIRERVEPEKEAHADVVVHIRRERRGNACANTRPDDDARKKGPQSPNFILVFICFSFSFCFTKQHQFADQSHDKEHP